MKDNVFINDWAGEDIADMMNDFGTDESDWEGATILLASYIGRDWIGKAFVLFEREGELYEINAIHCSCHGLESCDRVPVLTSMEALQFRVNTNDTDWLEYKKELIAVLDERASSPNSH